MVEALLSWVQAVSTEDVTSFADLSDGVVLFDIASRIAPHLFDDSGFNRQTDGNWLLNATNIKILISQINNIYSTLLKKDASKHIAKIDANAIAKDKNVASTQRLVELILGAAVQCEAKDDFIRVIMGMQEKKQQALMGLIQKQMATFPSLESGPSPSPQQDSPPPSPLAGGRSSFSEHLSADLETLQARYDELQGAHSELTEEAEGAQAKLDALNKAVEEGKSDNHELRSQVRAADARADDLQIDLESAQQQLESRDDEIKGLRRQINEKKSQNDNQALLDELDVLRDKLVNAQKNEVLLAKAKKRLEEMSELPNEIKSLEEQNAMLVKEASTAAGSAGKANTFKVNLEGANSQIVGLEGTIQELKAQLALKDKEIQRSQEVQNGLLGENQQLKTSNLELQQEIALQDDFDASPGSNLGGLGMSGGLRDSMANAESGAALAEAQALNAHLQQENEALHTSIAGLEERVSSQKLQEINYETTEDKLTAQQAEAQREIARLSEQLQITDQEVARLKEAYTKAVQVAQSLKSRLSAKQTNTAGEDQLAELQQQLDYTENKLQAAEEKAATAEHSLQSRGSEMRALDGELKSAQEENEGLKDRLREVVAQGEMLNRRLDNTESSQMGDTQEMSAHKLTIQSLQTQLAEKEKSLCNTQQQLDESAKLKDHEIKLVSTAFFEVGLELQKRWKAPQLNKTWLSKRRQTLNERRGPPR